MLQKILPKPDGSLSKGQSGRILVVGGSLEYCGAPYFAAMAAMRLGVDLAHIICHPAAAIPIKSYSPDLIVHPLRAEMADPTGGLLDRVDVLVVGSGLSRDPEMLMAARSIILMANTKDIPVVLDGDGIQLLMDLAFPRIPSILVVTPNHREFDRLCHHFQIDPEQADSCESLARRLSTVVLRKGAVDQISNGTGLTFCCEQGSPRRCGGQGDVLTGVLGAIIAWNRLNGSSKEALTMTEVCLLACIIVRKAAKRCFQQHSLSMLTQDLLQWINLAKLQLLPDLYEQSD